MSQIFIGIITITAHARSEELDQMAWLLITIIKEKYMAA